MTGPKLSLERLWVLMATAFVDMIGFALVLPLLPFYAKRFEASDTTVGILVAIYALAQMLTSPLWGRVSDRLGRRPVLMGSQALAGCAYILFAHADSVGLLFLSRFLQGSGGGTASVISAYVTDTVGPDERAKALGWITACTSAGVMIGPAIASFSVGWSYEAPGEIAAGLCVLNIFFVWRSLPESRAPQAPEEQRTKKRIRQQIVEVIRHPTVPTSSLIWIYSTGMMAFMAMNAVMALFLADRFGITERTIGWFYFSVGLVSVVMRAIILGRAVQRFGEVRVLRLGAVILGTGMLVAPLTVEAWQFLLCIILIPAGTALLFPSTTSLISRYADPAVVGQTMGVQQSFGGSSRLIGPVWAGAAFEHLGKGFPFWIAAGLVLATAVFSLRLRPGEAPRHGAVAAPTD